MPQRHSLSYTTQDGAGYPGMRFIEWKVSGAHPPWPAGLGLGC